MQDDDTKKPNEQPPTTPMNTWEPPGGLERPRYIRGTYDRTRRRAAIRRGERFVK